MDDGIERTHAPTQQRLQEARLDGRSPRSTDLTAAAALLTGLLLLAAMAAHLLTEARQWIEASLTATAADPVGQISSAIGAALRMLLPFALLVPLGALLIGATQTGLVFASQPLAPRISRLSPAEFFRRLLSPGGAVRVGMSVAKLITALAIAVAAAWWELPHIAALMDLDAELLLADAARIIFQISAQLAVALLLLGILDYFLQRHRHNRELHMTHTEARLEQKRTEGDPLTRSRRLTLARDLATRRMHGPLRPSDVLIVDPTRFAVALRYDGGLHAPKVIAKGAGVVADRLGRVAERQRMTIVTRPQVAQAICRSVQVGQPVPPKLYEQVAEVLACVMRLSRPGIADA